MNSLSRKLKFAIFGNEYQAKKSAAIQNIMQFMKEHDAEVWFDRTFFNFLTLEQHQNIDATGVFEGDDFNADFVLSMGGDGTFLKAASRVGSKQTPIIGVNTGRLGFLADVLPSEIEPALREICEGNYKIEEHAAIMIEAEGQWIDEYPFALNDIAVLKRDDASMISIRTSINGEYLVTYQADGLIVSTPTGSTAYNLSNGGPIVVPSADILCLTPVAPHSLNIRPIAIPDWVEVELEVESRSHNYLVAIDGRSIKMREGAKLIVKKAPYKVKIVKRSGQRYFSTLREKMMWGADTRN